MNRAERRMMMKKHPQYRKILKNASKNAVNGLKEGFEKKWEEADKNCGKPQITHSLQQRLPHE